MSEIVQSKYAAVIPTKVAVITAPRQKKGNALAGMPIMKNTREPKEPLKPQFFFSYNENSIMVKFHTMSFGLRKNASKWEGVSANITNAKELQYVTEIQKILRNRIKTGEPIKDIVAEFTLRCELAVTIRIFLNRMTAELPVTTALKDIPVTA
jgi:hypothetical protein